MADKVEEFFGYYVSNTSNCTTTTWVLLILFQIKAVIEGNLRSGGDIAQGHDPNPAAVQNCLTVWSATVIEKARRIGGDIAVEVPFRIQAENEFVVLFALPEGFTLINFLTGVVNDARAAGNIPHGESAGAVNGRRFYDD